MLLPFCVCCCLFAAAPLITNHHHTLSLTNRHINAQSPHATAVITTYETLRRARELLLPVRWGVAVLDEVRAGCVCVCAHARFVCVFFRS
jgi:hypothetical protein